VRIIALAVYGERDGGGFVGCSLLFIYGLVFAGAAGHNGGVNQHGGRVW
jgi:hypothetical protein